VPSGSDLRFAIVSAGTNSCRLLIATREAGGALRGGYHESRGTRLGQGVNESRLLDPEAVERTLAAVADYAQLCRGADRIFGIGTSALRDASNADGFIASFSELLGVRVDVLSGDEEAASSFEGAMCGMKAAGKAVPAAVTVVDVGGGSSEFATRAAEGAEPRVARRPSNWRRRMDCCRCDSMRNCGPAAGAQRIDRAPQFTPSGGRIWICRSNADGADANSHRPCSGISGSGQRRRSCGRTGSLAVAGAFALRLLPLSPIRSSCFQQSGPLARAAQAAAGKKIASGSGCVGRDRTASAFLRPFRA